MNRRTKSDATPEVEALQVKIALLRAGLSLHEWSRRNGFAQPTAWRGMHGVNLGPRAKAARARLAEFVGGGE